MSCIHFFFLIVREWGWKVTTTKRTKTLSGSFTSLQESFLSRCCGFLRPRKVQSTARDRRHTIATPLFTFVTKRSLQCNSTHVRLKTFVLPFFPSLSVVLAAPHFVCRVLKPQNYVAVSPSRQQVASQAAMESIPLVFEPRSRFYTNPVVVLDFQVTKSTKTHKAYLL